MAFYPLPLLVGNSVNTSTGVFMFEAFGGLIAQPKSSFVPRLAQRLKTRRLNSEGCFP